MNYDLFVNSDGKLVVDQTLSLQHVSNSVSPSHDWRHHGLEAEQLIYSDLSITEAGKVRQHTNLRDLTHYRAFQNLLVIDNLKSKPAAESARQLFAPKNVRRGDSSRTVLYLRYLARASKRDDGRVMFPLSLNIPRTVTRWREIQFHHGPLFCNASDFPVNLKFRVPKRGWRTPVVTLGNSHGQSLQKTFGGDRVTMRTRVDLRDHRPFILWLGTPETTVPGASVRSWWHGLQVFLYGSQTYGSVGLRFALSVVLLFGLFWFGYGVSPSKKPRKIYLWARVIVVNLTLLQLPLLRDLGLLQVERFGALENGLVITLWAMDLLALSVIILGAINYHLVYMPLLPGPDAVTRPMLGQMFLQKLHGGSVDDHRRLAAFYLWIHHGARLVKIESGAGAIAMTVEAGKTDLSSAARALLMKLNDRTTELSPRAPLLSMLHLRRRADRQWRAAWREIMDEVAVLEAEVLEQPDGYRSSHQARIRSLGAKLENSWLCLLSNPGRIPDLQERLDGISNNTSVASIPLPSLEVSASDALQAVVEIP